MFMISINCIVNVRKNEKLYAEKRSQIILGEHIIQFELVKMLSLQEIF